MPVGGRRPGAGRPPGSPNRRTAALARAVAEAAQRLDAVIPGVFAGDAHVFLCSIYRDPAQPIALRLEAAKAAIRYEKPALSSIEARGEVRHVVRRAPMTPEEWAAERAEVDLGKAH